MNAKRPGSREKLPGPHGPAPGDAGRVCRKLRGDSAGGCAGACEKIAAPRQYSYFSTIHGSCAAASSHSRMNGCAVTAAA